MNWETHLLRIGSLGENGEELGPVDLAGLLLDTDVEEQVNRSAVLSVSTFKGRSCLVAFLVLPPPNHFRDMRNFNVSLSPNGLIA